MVTTPPLVLRMVYSSLLWPHGQGHRLPSTKASAGRDYYHDHPISSWVESSHIIPYSYSYFAHLNVKEAWGMWGFPLLISIFKPGEGQSCSETIGWRGQPPWVHVGSLRHGKTMQHISWFYIMIFPLKPSLSSWISGIFQPRISHASHSLKTRESNRQWFRNLGPMVLNLQRPCRP